jgi:hypothetical protein
MLQLLGDVPPPTQTCQRYCCDPGIFIQFVFLSSKCFFFLMVLLAKIAATGKNSNFAYGPTNEWKLRS